MIAPLPEYVLVRVDRGGIVRRIGRVSNVRTALRMIAKGWLAIAPDQYDEVIHAEPGTLRVTGGRARRARQLRLQAFSKFVPASVGKTFGAVVAGPPEATGDPVRVSINGQEFDVQVNDPIELTVEGDESGEPLTGLYEFHVLDAEGYNVRPAHATVEVR